MWEQDCGCVPVVQEGDGEPPQLVGMLTDRDMSLADVARESKREESHVARAASVTAEAVGDTVAVIREPRTGHREVVPVG